MKKRITCLLLALLLLVQMPLMVAADGGDVARESRSGVVRICALTPAGYYSLGTGFGVGEVGEPTRYFVTNWHVVTATLQNSSGKVALYPAVSVWILNNSSAWNPVTGLDQTQCTPCEVIYRDDDGYPDIAVLKAVDEVPGRVALPILSDEDAADVDGGQRVYALGYPSSSDYFEAGDYGEKLVAEIEDVTITSGVVSRVTVAGALGDTKVIQHDATINHGNSGGPLLDENGAVIGINTYGAGMDPSSGDDNAYYSISSKYITEVLDDNDVYYELYEESNTLLIAIIAGIVILLAIAVVVILIVGGNKRKAQAAEQARQAEELRRQQEAAMASQRAAHVAPPVDNTPDPRPRLQCLSGALAGKRFSLQNSVRIGRDPSKNDLVIPANTQGVSSVHCVLMVDGTTVWLKDLGSTYGTYVSNGRRLAANEAVQLNIGDKFWLGSEREVFVIAPKGGI